MRKVAVIGSGFAGLAAASCLAKSGFDVTVFEKNAIPGGRARQLKADGFTFDMGPSFYWMPDVFEKYFALFGKKVSDYFQLNRLDPSYRIFFAPNDYIDVPAGIEGIARLFERLEPGSSKQLDDFLKEGKIKYDIGINNFVYKPGLSIRELVNIDVLSNVLDLHIFKSVSSYIRKFFKNTRIIQLLEFPVLFLGAAPKDTPALYTLMNYADFALGTWYPQGGMFSLVDAMVSNARDLGVKFRFNAEVVGVAIEQKKIKSIQLGSGPIEVDYVAAAGDYNHFEQQLLPREYRRYSESYWQSRTMAPSALLFYLGINKKLKNMVHHTLFFDEDFNVHATEIYKEPKWPSAPQFYVSCTTATDSTTAPAGCENLVVLIPVAAGLKDTPEVREKYFNIIVDRLEKVTGQSLRNNIVFKRSYAHRDFVSDYHAWKGNAYGLANTLKQTANLRPSIINKNVNNLFYTGQLTVPGPGVPPAIISGQVVATVIVDQQVKRAKKR